MNFILVRRLIWNTTLCILLGNFQNITAQDPLRFEEEIKNLLAQDHEVQRGNELIVLRVAQVLDIGLHCKTAFLITLLSIEDLVGHI